MPQHANALDQLFEKHFVPRNALHGLDQEALEGFLDGAAAERLQHSALGALLLHGGPQTHTCAKVERDEVEVVTRRVPTLVNTNDG